MLPSLTWACLSLACKSVCLIAPYTRVISNTESTGWSTICLTISPFFSPAHLGNTAVLSPLPFWVSSSVSMARRHLSLTDCFYQYPCYLLVSSKILLENNFPMLLFGSSTLSSPCLALMSFFSHLFTPRSSNLYPCLALVF